jgi:hypothetical protein
MHPELVQLLRNSNFVERAEIDAFALRAVSQGRIIEFHFGIVAHGVKRPDRVTSITQQGSMRDLMGLNVGIKDMLSPVGGDPDSVRSGREDK